jgi:hypothetical protein
VSSVVTLADAAGASLGVRRTPWDERALGVPTAEVVSLADADAVTAGRLLARLDAWCGEHGVRYVIARVSASDARWRLALEHAGWTQVECSLTLSRSGMGGLPAIPRAMRPTLRPALPADLPTLRRIAHDDFAHGRLLEDPAVDPAAGRLRTANWIEDLVQQGLAATAEIGGAIIGFHAERVDAGARSAELILTGTAGDRAMLALPLWTVALESLGARGIDRCNTLVSAANTGVINLYARLGFQFHQTLFGYRKRLP